MTAHYLCHSTYPVQAGDVAVVHAAAGGVGLLLTQMIKARGGTVIATTSTEEKAALARGAGADETIGYEGFRTRSRAHRRRGRAVDLRRDRRDDVRGGHGRAAHARVMVLYGMASGPAPAYDPQRLQARSLYLTRPGLPGYTATREELLSGRATCSAGSPTARSTSGSASATRSRTRAARTRTSKRGARPGSCF